MKNRPYFRSEIGELENIFSKSKDDFSVLKALRFELSHRDRHRAKELLIKVDQQLNLFHKPSHVNEVNTIVQENHFTNNKVDNRKEQKQVNKYFSSSDAFKKSHDDSEETEQEEKIQNNNFTNYEEDLSLVLKNVEVNSGPDSVLAAWLTQEVLTPQALPDARELESIRRVLVRLDEYPEPWNERRFWSHGKEKSVHWMVYLGELDLSKAMKAILNIYPDDVVEERADVRGNTTLAVVVLDSKGRPVEDKVFLSSFAWGYGQVLSGNLKNLASFPEAELFIKKHLEKYLIRQNEQGEILAMTANEINRAIGWLAKILNLPNDEVIRPGLAIRVPQWGNYNVAPEPELLNSFYIEDLVKVRNEFLNNRVGLALTDYMGATSEKKRKDVVREKGVLSETLAPSRFPLTRWPGPGRYPLVLMQQAAINHSVSELENSGVVAVNGPPGTGKTTLLRDLVAKVVLDRAIAMANFDNPTLAFKHVTSMKTGQAFAHLYQLDESLIGHEIVVASSNNKAVENISKEIPSISAISNDLDPPARYFQSISDAVAAGKNPIVDGVTWGLAAAVLGNSANRAAFIQSFYWHDKRGIGLYLKSILNGAIPDDNFSSNSDQILDVVTLEQPPLSEIEALERWRTRRSIFLSKLKDVEKLQNQAQAGYDAVHKKNAAIHEANQANANLSDARQKLAVAEDKKIVAEQIHKKAFDEEYKAREDRNSIALLRPGIFSRIFYTRLYREWRDQMSKAQSVLTRQRSNLINAENDKEHAIEDVKIAEVIVKDCEIYFQKTNTTLAKITKTIQILSDKIGDNFADEKFWEQDDDSLQLLSPWIFDEWQQARDALFVEAFSLHQSFINASAKPLRHNLRAALDVIKGRALKDKQEEVRRSLWASLFLVVPVISTTFASTAKLFGQLGREQLGWLLIDEAGQAVPQAAVGALWRAKRAIVIGDPLQIQPVVTTPPKLIRSIFGEFNINTEKWAAPDMSVQTLADRVSWFGTDIVARDGDIWVGSPLRVHRRCENPMFKISNHIAYEGLMVYGTNPSVSEIGRILGDSVWIDSEASDAAGKWSEEEGNLAIELLLSLLDEGLVDPDIFFITPFRIVAHKLREMIRSDRRLTERLPGKTWEWVRERVGTVHTFQGKEADTVVIVLGASDDASSSARRWAGYPPNLLNVAVTRAKRRLYVIGKRSAWKDAGAFSQLAQNLPVLEGHI